MISCCICLDDNMCNYTPECVNTICKHPVCVDCYKQLIEKTDINSGEKAKCPLCRVDIHSVQVEIEQAIYSINNISYECLIDLGQEQVEEIFFTEDEIIVICLDDEILLHTTKKMEINQYKYLNRQKNGMRKRIKSMKSYRCRK